MKGERSLLKRGSKASKLKLFKSTRSTPRHSRRSKRGPKPDRPWHSKHSQKPWYSGKPIVGSLVERHSDDRGDLVIVETAKTFGAPIGSIGWVTSKAGTVRANHLHLSKEGHTCVLISGLGRYYEEGIAPIEMHPGVPIFTPPKKAHAFAFLRDSVMLVIGNLHRTQEAYERDLKRLGLGEQLVTSEAIVAELTLPAQVEGAPV